MHMNEDGQPLTYAMPKFGIPFLGNTPPPFPFLLTWTWAMYLVPNIVHMRIYKYDFGFCSSIIGSLSPILRHSTFSFRCALMLIADKQQHFLGLI